MAAAMNTDNDKPVMPDLPIGGIEFSEKQAEIMDFMTEIALREAKKHLWGAFCLGVAAGSVFCGSLWIFITLVR